MRKRRREDRTRKLWEIIGLSETVENRGSRKLSKQAVAALGRSTRLPATPLWGTNLFSKSGAPPRVSTL